MDYEKKYNEALEKAKYYHDRDNIQFLENIFPELKESEDERIRKEILTAFSRGHDNSDIYGHGITYGQVRAWLEKQNTPAKLSEEEQNRFAKGILTSCAMSFIDYLDAHKYEGKMCVSNGECEDIENAFHNAMWDKLHRYYCKYIEKQGEMYMESYKAAEDEKREFVGDGFIKCYADFQDFKEGETYWLEYVGNDDYNVRSDNLLGKTYHITPCQLYTIFKKMTWLEKQGNKPQGKSAMEAAKEEKVDNANKVEPKDYNDIDPHFGKPTDKVEPKFKVGDWVVTDKCDTVQIGAVNNGYYTLYNGMIFNVSYVDKCWHLWTIADAKDGDVLKEGSCIFILREMKSKNTAITHCCLFDDGDFNLSPTLSFDVDSTFPATKEQRDLLFQKMHEAGYELDDGTRELKKIEQKFAWSEENDDDAWMNDIISKVENNLQLNKAEIDWLKSLKEKVQTKQECSEEDEKRIANILSVLSVQVCWDGATGKKKNPYQKEIDWLKSIRYQKQWKPSDKQINALSDVLSLKDIKCDVLSELLVCLKKLK